MKKETEGLLVAEQDQAPRTNVINNQIDKTQEDSKCRMCKEEDKTITHIIMCQCKKLAQKEYKTRQRGECSTLGVMRKKLFIP